MTLTQPQRLALKVLADAEGEPVDGWKRATNGELARPRINYLAAASLVRQGLARFHVGGHSPYGHTDRYSITAAGRLEAGL